MSKSVHNVGYRTDISKDVVYNSLMHRLPNQISSERADLLFQIAKCRRLAREVDDKETTNRLLALAAEYEQQLSQPHK